MSLENRQNHLPEKTIEVSYKPKEIIDFMDFMDQNEIPVTNRVLGDKFKLSYAASKFILSQMSDLGLVASRDDMKDGVTVLEIADDGSPRFTVTRRYHSTEKGREEGEGFGTIKFCPGEFKTPAFDKLINESVEYVEARAKVGGKSIGDLLKDPEGLAKIKDIKLKILNDFSPEELRQLSQDIKNLNLKRE